MLNFPSVSSFVIHALSAQSISTHRTNSSNSNDSYHRVLFTVTLKYNVTFLAFCWSNNHEQSQPNRTRRMIRDKTLSFFALNASSRSLTQRTCLRMVTLNGKIKIQ